MTQKQKSLVGGVSVLGIAGLICKVVAVVYRIPLAWLIGEQGLGTFQLVFPTTLMSTIARRLRRGDPAPTRRDTPGPTPWASANGS